MAKAKKLTLYLWTGVDKKGQKTQGEIEAASAMVAKASLRKQGILVRKLRKKSSSLFSKSKRVTASDIAIFARQLSTMMSAGVPLIQSFDIIIEGTDHGGIKDLTSKIKAHVESGSSLSEALSKYPKYFDPLFCNLIDAGEQSGALDQLLDRIATYKEKTESLKKKIKKAMYYPAAVLIVAIVVTAILLIFVVPQFEAMFNNFGAELPAFTLFVVRLSELMQAYWWIILASMVAAVYLFVQTKKRSLTFSGWIDILSLKAPIFGGLLRKAAIARYARTLATTFAAGVPLVEALVSVAGAAGNKVYTDAILHIRDEVTAGKQLYTSMRAEKVFPAMVIQMVSIGEESGALDDMLGKVADIYEEEVDNAVDALSSLLEPLIMVILGTLVGGLVVAMYLPIFQIGSVV